MSLNGKQQKYGTDIGGCERVTLGTGHCLFEAGEGGLGNFPKRFPSQQNSRSDEEKKQVLSTIYAG